MPVVARESAEPGVNWTRRVPGRHWRRVSAASLEEGRVERTRFIQQRGQINMEPRFTVFLTGFLLMAHGGSIHREAQQDCSFLDRYPRQYIAHYTHEAPTIDGQLNEQVWSDVGWSAPFVDIRLQADCNSSLC